MIRTAITALVVLSTTLTATAQDGWRVLSPPQAPSARAGHSLTYVGDTAYLFGGFSDGGRFNDLWRWDGDSGAWVELFPPNPPSPRFGHSAVAAGGRLWVVLGQDGTTEGSIWSYDPAANAWHDETPADAEFSTRNRMGTTVVTDGSGDEWIVFSGGLTFFFENPGDVWALRIRDGELRRLPDLPQARYGHVLLPTRAVAKSPTFTGLMVAGGRDHEGLTESQAFLALIGEEWDDEWFETYVEPWLRVDPAVGPAGNGLFLACGGENENGVTDAAETLQPRYQSPDFGPGIVGVQALPQPLKETACAVDPTDGSALLFGGFDVDRWPTRITATLSDLLPELEDPVAVFVAGNGRGVGGIQWATSAAFRLPDGADDCTATLEVVPCDFKTSQACTTTLELQPGIQFFTPDVLAELFGLEGSRAVVVRAADACLDALTSAVRISSSDGSMDGPSRGQGFALMPSDEALVSGDEGAILGLRSGDGFRTNLGFIALGGAASGVVEFLDADTGQSVGELEFDLEEDDFLQITKAVETAAGGVVRGVFMAKYRVLRGRFVFGYASVVDNATGDPYDTRSGRRFTDLYIPVAARVDGVGGDLGWRTDAWIRAEDSGGQGPVTVEIGPSPGFRKSASQVVLSLAPGEVWRSDDVLGDVFGSDGSTWLRIQADAPVQVFSRIWSQFRSNPSAGTSGQAIPVLDPSDAFGPDSRVSIPGLRRSSDPTEGLRANLGIVNFDDAPLEVEVELYADGGSLLGVVPLSLPAGETVVVTDIYRRVTSSDVGNGFALIRAVGGGGAWYAFGSLVDNVTGDAATIPAS
jgi:hypothetical protein